MMKQSIWFFGAIGIFFTMGATVSIHQNLKSISISGKRIPARVEFENGTTTAIIANADRRLLPYDIVLEKLFYPVRRNYTIGNVKIDIPIEAFGEYPELLYLGLADVGRVDLTKLEVLKNLQYLDLSRTQLAGFGSAASESIRILNLSDSRLIGTETLEFGLGWKALEELNLNVSPAAKINYGSLKNLPSLKKLALRNTPDSLDFLKSSQLEELKIGSSMPIDLAPLAELPLKRLIVFGQVKDLSVLRKMRHLNELDISVSGDQDFSMDMIAALPLRRLTLRSYHRGTRQDAELLAKLPLRQLRLFGCFFEDISPVLRMPLESLALDGFWTKFDPIMILKDNKNLRYLSLGRIHAPPPSSPLSPVWPELAQMPLVGLILGSAVIDDLSFIRDMKELRILVLPASTKDLAVLGGMKFDILIADGVKNFEEQCGKYKIEVSKQPDAYSLPVNEKNYTLFDENRGYY